MLKGTSRLTLILLVAAATRPLALMAAPNPTAEQDIRHLEERWLQNEDNPAALQSILADDFVHAGPYGFITKQQQLDYMRQHPRVRPDKRSFEELRVRIYGDVAIANGIVRAVAPGGVDVTRTVFTDVFVRRKGTWQAVNAQELPLEEDND